jgi:hypothetical protein
MLFRGFNHFVPCLAVLVTHLVPTIALLLSLYFAMFANMFAFLPAPGAVGPPDVADFLGFFGVQMLLVFAFSLVITLIQSLLIFAYPLIVDRRLGGFRAVATSARAVLGNPGGVLGLVFLWFLVGLFAPLLCYVGLFFLMPISYAALTVAYRKVFPMTYRFDDYFDDEDDDEPPRRERVFDNEPFEYLPSTAITSEPPPPRPSTDIQAEAPDPVPPASEPQA